MAHVFCVFEIDGAVIEYASVETTVDWLTPQVTGIPTNAIEGTELLFQTQDKIDTIFDDRNSIDDQSSIEGHAYTKQRSPRTETKREKL